MGRIYALSLNPSLVDWKNGSADDAHPEAYIHYGLNTPILSYAMPKKSRRAGRKKQYRRLISSLYYHAHPSTCAYVGVEPPIPINKGNDNSPSCSKPAESCPQPRPQCKAYGLSRIEFEYPPKLPSSDLPHIPGDPRFEFYNRLRQTLLHEFYDGPTPPRVNTDGPETTSQYNHVATVSTWMEKSATSRLHG